MRLKVCGSVWVSGMYLVRNKHQLKKMFEIPRVISLSGDHQEAVETVLHNIILHAFDVNYGQFDYNLQDFTDWYYLKTGMEFNWAAALRTYNATQTYPIFRYNTVEQRMYYFMKHNRDSIPTTPPWTPLPDWLIGPDVEFVTE